MDIDYEICDNCADSVAVLVSAAEVFGSVPAEVLSGLCIDCATGLLDVVVGKGPRLTDPDPNPEWN